MKKTILLVLGLFFFSNIASALVTFYPGTEFINDDLTVGFSNPNGINVTYAEFGDDYILFDEYNLSFTYQKTGIVEKITDESFEDAWPPAGWSETGNWNKESDEVHSGSFSADFDGDFVPQSGDLKTPALDCSDLDVSEINVSFWGYDEGSDDGDYYLDYYNGAAWNEITRLDNFGEGAWEYYQDTITDSQYFVSDFKVRWRAVALTIGERVYVDDVNISTTENRSIEVNFSMYNNISSIGNSGTIMRFNVTRLVGNVVIYLNNSNAAIWTHRVYTDNVLSSTQFSNRLSWSYNSWSTHDFEVTATLGWGNITVNVYNESNFAQIISPFGLEISNQSGTETYQNYSCTSNHVINVSNMPYGENTIFLVNATGYRDRTYYYDILQGYDYNLTFYLPPILTPVDPGSGDDGGDNVTTRNYYINVKDQYQNPLSDVHVAVARLSNVSGEYETVQSDITDGQGNAQFNLIPRVNYRATLTKTGYVQIGDPFFQPDPNEYGIFYPIPLLMEMDYNETGNVSFWDVCYFNGTMYSNNSLYVYFEEFSDDFTVTNAQFYTYELHNFTSSLNATNITTSETFGFWVTQINTSRTHRVILHINHSNFGYDIVTIMINPLRTPLKTTSDIENKATGVFGDFDLGYVNFFLLFIPVIAMLVIFGPSHAGLGVIASGMYIGFASIFISVPEQVIYLIPVVIVFGVILIIVKKGRMGI